MSEELVDVVDENNNVIKVVSRSEMRKNRQPHRATYIVLYDFNDKFYVQVRTKTKDYYPGFLDACTGGVVTSGEQYYESALRELKEEMGIENYSLVEHGIHKLSNGLVFGGIYSLQYEGKIIPQESEVEDVLMMSIDEIFANQSKFTPDSIEALKIFKDKIMAN